MARTDRPGTVLDRRALNRALRERQLLLRRSSLPAAAAIEQLVGFLARGTEKRSVRLGPAGPMTLAPGPRPSPRQAGP